MIRERIFISTRCHPICTISCFFFSNYCLNFFGSVFTRNNQTTNSESKTILYKQNVWWNDPVLRRNIFFFFECGAPAMCRCQCVRRLRWAKRLSGTPTHSNQTHSFFEPPPNHGGFWDPSWPDKCTQRVRAGEVPGIIGLHGGCRTYCQMRNTSRSAKTLFTTNIKRGTLFNVEHEWVMWVTSTTGCTAGWNWADTGCWSRGMLRSSFLLGSSLRSSAGRRARSYQSSCQILPEIQQRILLNFWQKVKERKNISQIQRSFPKSQANCWWSKVTANWLCRKKCSSLLLCPFE